MVHYASMHPDQRIAACGNVLLFYGNDTGTGAVNGYFRFSESTKDVAHVTCSICVEYVAELVEYTLSDSDSPPCRWCHLPTYPAAMSYDPEHCRHYPLMDKPDETRRG